MATSGASTGMGVTPGGGRLPVLLGVAAALGLWMAGETLQERVKAQEQQIASTSQAVLPRAARSLPEAERSAADARQRRSEIEARLNNSEPVAFVQAKVVHDLRQRCTAEGIQGCVVKYADDALRPEQRPPAATSPGAARPAADKASAASVAELGLGKARAVISGTFQDLEFRRFLTKLGQGKGEGGLWRINGLVVRNNTFEIDAELIVRPASGGGSRQP